MVVVPLRRSLRSRRARRRRALHASAHASRAADALPPPGCLLSGGAAHITCGHEVCTLTGHPGRSSCTETDSGMARLDGLHGEPCRL